MTPRPVAPPPLSGPVVGGGRSVAEVRADLALLAERDSLRGVVQAVRAMHQPEACDCNHCDGEAMRCPQCIGHWPCDTAAALAAAADPPQPTREGDAP